MTSDIRLDHCFVVVHDLDEAARKMRALGFRVSGRNLHTAFGSANHLVVFDGNYIELIGIVDQSLGHIPEHQNLAAWLAEGECWTRTAFEPGPMDQIGPDLASRGIVVGNTRTWERQADLGDGTSALARFSTANILQSATSRHDFFLCHHHNPGAVYSNDQMNHPNGALRIVEGVIFVDDLGAIGSFLDGLFPNAVRASPDGVEVELPGVLLRFRPRGGDSLRPIITVLMENLDFARAVLADAGMGLDPASERIEVRPELTPGFDLVLTAADPRR